MKPVFRLCRPEIGLLKLRKKSWSVYTGGAWYLSLIISIGIVFLIDFIMVRGGIASINDKQFFGFLGSNLFAIRSSIIMLMVFYYIIIKNKLFVSGWFVIAGALTNIVDRIYFGGVPDYFSIFFIPRFNISDVFIVFGLFISLFLYTKRLN